jgi:3-hydroxyisobutyrate dehydrogenase-like beta-hydroxyacid dehydrogenase
MPVRMKEGAWTIFASGKRTAFDRVRPILNVFTRNVPYVGTFGNGTKMKYVANHLVAIYNVAAAETITLARKMGLAPQQVLELFGPSPVVGNGVLRLRGALMVARNYLPATMKVAIWRNRSTAPRRFSPPACRFTTRRWRRDSRKRILPRCAKCWA